MSYTIASVNDIKALIKQLREKGWTISAIADEVGVGRDTVSTWQSGKFHPANAKMVRLGLQELLKRERVPPRRRYRGNHYLQRRQREREGS